MFYALDKCGNRLHISGAIRTEQYFCPVCKSPVIIKEGDIVTHHFAHLSNKSCDPWYIAKMSPWHCDMQSLFPDVMCEVVVKRENTSEYHIADVLVNSNNRKYVFEFQHSPISVDDFLQRTYFYTQLGISLIWVFDFRDPNNPKNIYYDSYDSKCTFKRVIWPGKDRIKLFDSSRIRTLLNECTSGVQLAIWFHIQTGQGIKYEKEYFDGITYSKWNYLYPNSKEDFMVRVFIDSLVDISDFHANFYTKLEFHNYVTNLCNGKL